MTETWWKYLLLVIGVMTIATLFGVLLSGCTDEDRSRQALENSGYTDIQLKGYGWFECGDDDRFHTEFRAKNPAGKMVEGVVCCGYWKGCTIRF